jgi:hypothetical protein
LGLCRLAFSTKVGSAFAISSPVEHSLAVS